jgi:voltage-gated potassium channel
VVLAVGLVGFVALAVYQIRRILDSPMPQLRAAETLATVVPLVIVAFALFYVAMSDADPNGFTEPMTKVNGLYFTVTVLATVGFGDIAARTDAARIAVTVQMIVDLLIIGVLVKVILGASRIAVERRRAEAEDRAGPGATGSGPPS